MDSHTTIVLEGINNTLSDILKILKAQPNKHPYGTLHCAKCNKPMPQTEKETNEAKLDNHPTSKLY